MRKPFFNAVVLLVVAAVAVTCSRQPTEPIKPVGNEAQFEAAVFADNQGLRRAMEVQEKHTPSLLARPEVVGTATGLTEDGRPAVLLLLKEAVPAGTLPAALDGVPVVLKVTGEIKALGKPDKPGKPPKKEAVDPASWFPRPVPIGVSTGNINECAAGTIACRVKDGQGNVYALSNNHVFARENLADPNEWIMQPGRYDEDPMCAIVETHFLGTLAAFVEINFGGENMVDAAIAAVDPDSLGTATPSDGYGTPKTSPVGAELGMSVQKYGRTTGLTSGTITGINATVTVGYTNGDATFVDQIIIESRKPFLKPGDSGSLVVVKGGENDRAPVGLLFAGNSTGKLGVANPIQAVLDAFGVTIDGAAQ